MARNIGAFFAGLGAAIVALVVLLLVIGQAFPVAAGVNARDPGEIKVVFSGLASTVKLLILLTWLLGPLAGTWVARRIGSANWPVWTVAVLLALYVGLTVAILPMPGWMQAASVVAPLLAGLIAHHFAPAPATAGAEPPDFDA